MPHIKSDRLYILAFAVALILVVAGIGFAIGQITRTPPPPTPTPIPTPTPEPKAGISDYASLFAKMDKNLFPPEQYHTLLTRLTDCLPNLTSEFKAEFSDTTLSEGETAALLHFMASATVTVANTSLQLMRLIDEQFVRSPFCGWRKMTAYLRRLDYAVHGKRVRRLMCLKPNRF